MATPPPSVAVPAGAAYTLAFTAVMGVGGQTGPVTGLVTVTAAANATTRSFGRLTHAARGFVNIRWGNIFGLSTSLIALGTGIDRLGGKVTKAFTGWIEVAGEFEKKLVELEVVAGTTAENLVKMKDAALKLGIETMFPPSEVLNTMTSLAAAGLEYGQTMAALPAVLDLVAASMGRLKLEQGAEIGIAAMTKFKLKPDEIEPFVNQLTRLGQITNLRPQGFLGFIEALGSSMQQLRNTPREQILAIGAMLTNVGMSHQRAGRATALFVTGLQQIGKETLELPGARGRRMQGLALLGLGEHALKDARGDFHSILDIIQNIGAAADKQGLSVDALGQAMQIAFPAKNARDLITLTKNLGKVQDETTGEWHEGAAALGVMARELARVKNELGFTHDLAEKYLGTWQGLQALWKGSKEAFGVLMGETPLPFLTKGGGVLLTVFNRFLDLLKAWPELRGAFATATLALGAFVKGAGMALIAMGSLIGVILLLGLIVTQLPVVLLGITAIWGVWAIVLPVLATKLFMLAVTLGVVALAARSFGEAWQRSVLRPLQAPATGAGFFEGLGAVFRQVRGSLSGEGYGLTDKLIVDEHAFLQGLARDLTVWGFMIQDAWGVIMGADYTEIKESLKGLGDALLAVLEAFGKLFGLDTAGLGPDVSPIARYTHAFKLVVDMFVVSLDKLTASVEAYARANAALPAGSTPLSPTDWFVQKPDYGAGITKGVAGLVAAAIGTKLLTLGVPAIMTPPGAIMTLLGAILTGGGLWAVSSGAAAVSTAPTITGFGDLPSQIYEAMFPSPVPFTPHLSSFRETSPPPPPDPLRNLWQQAYGPRSVSPGRGIRTGPITIAPSFTINAGAWSPAQAEHLATSIEEKLSSDLNDALLSGW